jgi:hypothetical protein
MNRAAARLLHWRRFSRKLWADQLPRLQAERRRQTFKRPHPHLFFLTRLQQLVESEGNANHLGSLFLGETVTHAQLTEARRYQSS